MCFHTGDPTRTDLFELVKLHLGGISGGQEVSTVILRFHQALSSGYQEKIQFITGFCLSYRCLDQTLKTIRYLVGQGVNPVQSLVWSVLRNYASAVATTEDRRRMFRLLGDTLKLDDIASKESYRTLPVPEREEMDKWLVESKELSYLMCQLEKKISMILVSALSVLSKSDSIDDGACRFVEVALRRFFLLKHSHDSLLQNATDKCPLMAKELKLWIEKSLLPTFKGPEFNELNGMPNWDSRHEFIKGLKKVCHNLQGHTGELFVYLDRASFDDILDRGREIAHMRSVLANINQVLCFEGDLTKCHLNSELKKFLQHTASVVTHLEVIVSTAHSWVQNMKPDWMHSVYEDFDSALKASNNTAALHKFQMQLKSRIKNGALGWPSLSVAALSLVQATGCAQESLMPYALVLQWQGFDWEFILNPVYRTLSISPPSLDFLTSEKILRMEEDHCIETLEEECKRIIEDRSGLLVTFDSYIQKGKALEKRLEKNRTWLQDEDRKLKQKEREVQSKQVDIERMESKKESIEAEISHWEEALAQTTSAERHHVAQGAQEVADNPGDQVKGQCDAVEGIAAGTAKPDQQVIAKVWFLCSFT